MKPGNRAVGLLAEEIACRHLGAIGYHIIGKNVRTRYGEIDLVAQVGDMVVFCEVKARRGGQTGGAEAAVDERKMRKLAKLAAHYLAEHEALAERPCRFDVVLLTLAGGLWRVEVVADAFRPGWSFLES